MAATPGNSDAAAQIQQIADQRQALESLIKIATGIHNQQKALSEIALAAKPSQKFPPKVMALFKEIEKRLKDATTPEVLKRLEAFESVTVKQLRRMLQLASLDVNQLRDGQLDNISSESFSQFINDFKRRARTSLGLRILLQKRGVAIAPFELPISQEEINLEIEKLKAKEVACRKQIKNEIRAIISDCESLLGLPDLDENNRQHLAQVVAGMKVNLKYLDSGGAIDKIPNQFEIIVMQSEDSELDDLEPPDQKNTNELQESLAPEASNDSLVHTQKSFLWLIGKWLRTPWKTSWRSLKQKYRPPQKR